MSKADRRRRSGRGAKKRAIPGAYWLMFLGAILIGASAFQLLLLGKYGFRLGYVLAVVVVLGYIGACMAMAVRMSHDDDEWKPF